MTKARTRFSVLALSVAGLLGIMAGNASSASADSCSAYYLGGWECTWHANQAPNSWRFFEAAEPKRNWWSLGATDHYENAVGKCIKASNGSGWVYREFCNAPGAHFAGGEFSPCNCGGLLAGTHNLASGYREIFSNGFHGSG